jgi:hypothetical protein
MNYQLTAQLALMFLDVSAVNHSHLQGARSAEYIHSEVHKLSNINGKFYVRFTVQLELYE